MRYEAPGAYKAVDNYFSLNWNFIARPSPIVKKKKKKKRNAKRRRNDRLINIALLKPVHPLPPRHADCLSVQTPAYNYRWNIVTDLLYVDTRSNVFSIDNCPFIC